MIFDEIDTGISGHVAQAVAEKMASIGRYHQVLCVDVYKRQAWMIPPACFTAWSVPRIRFCMKTTFPITIRKPDWRNWI